MVASLWARVRDLEERLALANLPAATVAEEAEPPATDEAGAPAAPPEEAAPSPPPAAAPPLIVASKLYENEWSHDTEERLVEAAAREAGSAEKAQVACTHDECRVELTDAEGAPAGQRAHKILADVSMYLPHVDVVSDEKTGKTTIVVARTATAPPG
jgi:hypothetical protein